MATFGPTERALHIFIPLGLHESDAARRRTALSCSFGDAALVYGPAAGLALDRFTTGWSPPAAATGCCWRFSAFCRRFSRAATLAAKPSRPCFRSAAACRSAGSKYHVGLRPREGRNPPRGMLNAAAVGARRRLGAGDCASVAGHGSMQCYIICIIGIPGLRAHLPEAKPKLCDL